MKKNNYSASSNKPTADKTSEIIKSLIENNSLNKLMVYPFNLIKFVNSKANIPEIMAIEANAKNPTQRICLIAFILPEYLCFSGATEEVYDIAVVGHGFKYDTFCRLDNDLQERVFFNNKEFTQLFGQFLKIEEYKSSNFPDAEIIISNLLKSVFTIALRVQTVEDDVQNTAIRRTTIRMAVAGLNKYADIHRQMNNLAWSTVPHYSFFSFPYAYLREFDLDGKIISSEKYMMNPAIGILPERPHFIDPDGSYQQRFRDALINESYKYSALNMFKKGQAYEGHGHDLIGIRLCVSAIESTLRTWAKKYNINFRKSSAEKATIKKLFGKFEVLINRERLVEKPSEFIKSVKEAINLRHEIEHRELYLIDSTVLFPTIEVLETFFNLIQSQTDKKA